MVQTSSPLPKKKVKVLKFADALKEIVEGKKVTKLEWKDVSVYGLLKEGRLKIKLKDNMYHDWILSDGDLTGEDYVVLDGNI